MTHTETMLAPKTCPIATPSHRPASIQKVHGHTDQAEHKDTGMPSHACPQEALVAKGLLGNQYVPLLDRQLRLELSKGGSKAAGRKKAGTKVGSVCIRRPFICSKPTDKGPTYYDRNCLFSLPSGHMFLGPI